MKKKNSKVKIINEQRKDKKKEKKMEIIFLKLLL